MKRRGELTSTQIIGLVIAIIGFLIVLGFYSSFNVSDYTEDQVCHLSVLTRATSPDLTQRLIPLKCRTKKICFSTGKNDPCNAFIGDKNVETITLSSNPEKAADEIEKKSAEEMLRCWNLMGEGKLNLFTGLEKTEYSLVTDFLKIDEAKPYCVRCSRMAMSEKLKNSPEIISNVNLLEYMSKTKIKETGLTYLQTFTDKQIATVPSEIYADLGSFTDKKTDHIAIMFMQVLVENKGVLESAYDKGATSGLTVLTLAGYVKTLNPLGVLTNTFGLKSTIVASLLVGGVSGLNAGYMAWSNQMIAAQYCGPLTGESEHKFGCSVVAPIDQNNERLIGDLCTKIDDYE